MILKIFYCAQYFNKPLAAYLDVKSLPMGGFPYELALIGVWVVERSMMFTEMQRSRLSWFGFGHRFLLEGK